MSPTGDPHFPHGCWCGIDHYAADYDDAYLAGMRAAGGVRIGDDVLATVLNLVIHHSLTHPNDPGDLAIAAEFLKAVRDEGPNRIALLYDRWADDLAKWKANRT